MKRPETIHIPPTVPHGTILTYSGEVVLGRKAPRLWVFLVPLMAGVLGLGLMLRWTLGLSVEELDMRAPRYKVEFASDPLRFNSPFWIGLPPSIELNEPIWPAGHAKLTEALDIWTREVGVRIPRPRLMYGTCSTYAALACADPKENTVTIPDLELLVLQKKMYLTVMLHEVGHLYGVPHIEGDLLMHYQTARPVEAPTPFAVALAKVVHRVAVNQ